MAAPVIRVPLGMAVEHDTALPITAVGGASASAALGIAQMPPGQITPEQHFHDVHDRPLPLFEALPLMRELFEDVFGGNPRIGPAEMYGLRWSDIDFRADEVRVERQYVARTQAFELPKNGRSRLITLTPPAREALLELPRPVDADQQVFRASRGGPMTGRVQHYYWHPVRCRFGKPSMDFYELRHFCGAWLFNDLELPAQDVAHQLGHTDGGALVQRLYGHPSERLARERIKRAASGSLAAVSDFSEAERRRAGL